MDLLSQTQILTKFYKLEKNYAHNFFQYHSSIGVDKFVVITQTDEDTNFLKTFTEYNIKILVFSDNLTPGECVQSINFQKHRFFKAKYTILLDFDEFLELPANIDLSRVQEIINSNGSISLRWLMRISLDAKNPELYGFPGHIGKQWALTSLVHKPLNDHLLIKPNIFEHQNTSIRLVHSWSRSLNDIIAKSLFSRYRDIKTTDQNKVVELLAQNKLPNRLKLLAYLSIIPKNIMISTVLQSPNTYKEDNTMNFINEKVGGKNANKIRYLFTEYKSRLVKDIFEYSKMMPHKGFSYEHFPIKKQLYYCHKIMPFYPNHNKSNPSLRQIIDLLPDLNPDSL